MLGTTYGEFCSKQTSANMWVFSQFWWRWCPWWNEVLIFLLADSWLLAPFDKKNAVKSNGSEWELTLELVFESIGMLSWRNMGETWGRSNSRFPYQIYGCACDGCSISNRFNRSSFQQIMQVCWSFAGFDAHGGVSGNNQHAWKPTAQRGTGADSRLSMNPWIRKVEWKDHVRVVGKWM